MPILPLEKEGKTQQMGAWRGVAARDWRERLQVSAEALLRDATGREVRCSRLTSSRLQADRSDCGVQTSSSVNCLKPPATES